MKNLIRKTTIIAVIFFCALISVHAQAPVKAADSAHPAFNVPAKENSKIDTIVLQLKDLDNQLNQIKAAYQGALDKQARLQAEGREQLTLIKVHLGVNIDEPYEMTTVENADGTHSYKFDFKQPAAPTPAPAQPAK